MQLLLLKCKMVHNILWIIASMNIHSAFHHVQAAGVASGPCGEVSALTEGGAVLTDAHICYELVPTPELWSVARDRCWRRGGRLVEVGDESIKNKLKDKLQALGWQEDGVWTGLNDVREEGTWEWVAGNGEPPIPLGWSNWAEHSWLAGLSAFAEDCAYMNPKQNWKWRKAACSLKLNKYICQYNLKGFEETTTSGVSIRGEGGRLDAGDEYSSPITTEKTSQMPPVYTGQLVVESEPEFGERAEAGKTATPTIELRVMRVLRLALFVAVGVAVVFSLLLTLVCILFRRKRERSDKVSSGFGQPTGMWYHDDSTKRYVRANLGTNASSGLAQTIIPNSQNKPAMPVIEPYCVDELYLHMGQKMDVGPLHPHSTGVADVSSELPVSCDKYRTISDYRQANVYETIDEIRRQLDKNEA